MNKNKRIDSYIDGSEKYLLDLFQKPESQLTNKIDKLLKDPQLPWPILYHIFPQRHMLLNWYPFEKDSHLLEIGAGCGALTGLFLQKVSKVTCNELTINRAKIIKKRFSDYKNLTVFEGNMTSQNIKEKFDYITIIGVLEYSAKYSSSTNPYKELLQVALNLLKPNGHLLLAIENKIGLKYISGAPEDHTGVIFDSLENYSQDKQIRTFTRNELTNLLHQSGFKNIEYYYPFPDYKLPQIVFSEDGLKTINTLTKSSITATVDHSATFEKLFNEVSFSHLLDKEEILNKFTNSFLIDATI